MGSVPSTALSHITGQHISWLKCAAVCAHSTQWWCQHYNSVNNMLRSCLVCMIETSSGGPSLSLSLRSGRICLAGRQASPGFWPAVEAEFPVYFQRCVFILGDWGDCVSLKARPLPLPKCEMLRLGDAGLLLFVRTSLSQLGIPGQKVSAAFRGQEHAAFFEFLQQATTWEYILISSLIFLFYLF